MKLEALIWMVSVQATVIFITISLFRKVLKKPSDYDEQDDGPGLNGPRTTVD